MIYSKAQWNRTEALTGAHSTAEHNLLFRLRVVIIVIKCKWKSFRFVQKLIK